jgi:IS30 family transposase
MTKPYTKGLHLTIDNREFIEDALNMKLTLQEMADHIGKDKTTISKEIKRNRILLTRNPEQIMKACQHQSTCKKQHVCSNFACDKICKRCKHKNCFSLCQDYGQKTCRHLQRYPHVCNNCDQKIGCRLLKYKYRAKDAQLKYENQLVKSREGIDLTAKELKELDELITPLVEKGQSLKHIHVNHQIEIGRSQRSLYNYFEMNLFTVRNIDLPRKVKCKPRKKKKSQSVRNTTYNIDRKYQDYLNHMANYPDTQVVQMDTVYNAKGGPGILTLFFVGIGLMLGYYHL